MDESNRALKLERLCITKKILGDLRLRVYRYDVCYRSVLINFREK